MKKIVSFLLIITMLISIFCGLNINAYAVTLYWPVPGHTPPNSISQGFHDGNAIDISDSNIAGAKVIAALGGTVQYKYTCAQQHYGSLGDCNGFGTGIVIKGTDGRTYQYAHMQANSIPSNVYVGATVKAGQEVGKVGTTGNSSGNHLHFAIAYQNYWENGVNPLNESYNYSEPSSLGKPTNLRVQVRGGIVQLFWNAASGANCYDVILTKPNGTTDWLHASGTSKDIRNLAYGIYKVEVQSLYRPNGSSTGQTVGPHSDVLTFEYNMQSAVNIQFERTGTTITVTWDAADGANCYDVIVKNPKGETNWYHTVTTSKTFTGCIPGNYVFDIQSLYRVNNSSSGQKVGPHSGEFPYLFALDGPKNLKASNDEDDNLYLAWDAVDGATCYDVIIEKPDGNTDYLHTHDTNKTITNYSFGTYTLNIQSLYRENEWTSNQFQVVGNHSEKLTYNYQKHQHTLVTDAYVAPTCTQPGKTEGSHCSTCSAIIVAQNSIPATGHSFVSDKEYCQNGCGTVNPNYVAPHIHDYKEVVTAPTATKLGFTRYKCSCGEYILDDKGAVLTDTYTAPTGKIGGFKCKARTAAAQTIIWNKVAGVTGYQIQMSNAAGNKWEVTKALTANSITFKSLKAGNNYKFRVRFYIKAADGKNYFSPWSATLNSPTLPSGTTLTKVTAGSKSFTVNWKKQAVTGYQVQYSTKSNFSGAKTVTIKNAKTLKTTVKKLSAKKVYYVRVRTYKTINKANYFSTWSKALKVKTK